MTLPAAKDWGLNLDELEQALELARVIDDPDAIRVLLRGTDA